MRDSAPYTIVAVQEGTAPGFLWLLGEQGFARLRIAFPNYPDEDHLDPDQSHALQSIRAQYPEAEVSVWANQQE